MKLPAATTGTFEKCPAGNHLAICYEVIDLGTQHSEAYGDKHQVWLGWETPNETMDDGRPYVIGNFYNFSMNEKATLRLHLESWRGKPFTDADIGPEGTFLMENLLGIACFLNVVHTEKGGKERATVEAVAPLPKGVEAPALVNEKIFLSLDEEEFDPDVFNKLTDWMKESVARSPEYKALVASTGKQPVPAPAAAAASGNDDSPF